MKSIYQSTPLNPYHLSVGAVVFDSENNILCHKYNMNKGYDLYLLMTETVENNETLIEALKRGLMEEFGAEAEVTNFIGSFKTNYNIEDNVIEKTVIFYSCKLINRDNSKRLIQEHETKTEVISLPPQDLIKQMKLQATTLKNQNYDQSNVILRSLK